MVDQRAVEAVARAMCEADHGHWPEKYQRMAQAALAAARPIIMEQAAGIALDEAYEDVTNSETAAWNGACHSIAQAIRTAGIKTDD